MSFQDAFALADDAAFQQRVTDRAGKKRCGGDGGRKFCAQSSTTRDIRKQGARISRSGRHEHGVSA
jgi:hypothetical protein